HVTGVSVAERFGSAVVEHLADDEMQLHIGNVELRIGPYKAACLGKIRRDHPARFLAVAADLAEEPREAAERNTEEIARIGIIGEDEVDMVLQIAANTGEIVHNINVELAQVRCWTDAGKHQ